MHHRYFAAALGAGLLVVAPTLRAQPVPGRDLLDFPLGSLAEAAPLATTTAGGLYNPAALLLGPGGRGRLSVSHLNAPGERGLTGELAAFAWRPRARVALALSAARAGIRGIDRTDEDPQTIGSAVRYDTDVVSAGAAVRPLRWLSAGGAVRYRHGRSDTTSAGAWGVDGGVAADGLLGARDLRVGASSFLWRSGAGASDRPTFLVGSDVRVWGDWPRAPAGPVAREVRAGASWLASRGGEREGYVFAAGRLRSVEGRAGIARASLPDSPAQTRLRLALGLHYARFVVGVAREESDPGFGPIYQFTLSTLFP